MDELDELVKRIFDIIPSYYDEKEADEIRKMILEYIENNSSRN